MGGEKSESTEASRGLILALFAAVLFSASCDLLSSVETHNGIQYQRGSTRLRSTGTVEKGILARDTTIQGNMYGAGSSVEFSSAESLSSATLARDTTIQGCVYAASSTVELTRDSRVLRGKLAAPCQMLGGVTLPRGTMEFDSSGHDPSIATLSEDAVVAGLKFKAKTQLTFRSSSKLLRGTLASGNVFHGLELDEGEVTFDEEGLLKRAVLGSQIKVGDVRLNPGTRITFAKDGRILCARLPSEVFSLGTVEDKTEVCFDAEGKVSSTKNLPKPRG